MDSLPPVIEDERAPVVGKPWGFWATMGWSAIIGLATLLVQGAVGFAFFIGRGDKTIQPELLAENGLVLALTIIVALPVTVSLCSSLAWLRSGVSIADYLGLRMVPAKVLWRWLAILGAYIVVAELATLAVGRSVIADFMIKAIETAVFLPMLWAAIIVAAPVSEEILFRGFMLPGLHQSKIGKWPAILITSALWSLLHTQYDAYQMAWIFGAGVLLGMARITTGSIFVPLAIHVGMNLIATIETAIYMALRS